MMNRFIALALLFGVALVHAPAHATWDKYASGYAEGIKRDITAPPKAAVPATQKKAAPAVAKKPQLTRTQVRRSDGIAHWRHYGADHAYASKAAAKADAANVFHRAGWPPRAVVAMVEKMKESSERIELRNGDHLDFMRSGKHALWRNVEVDFAAPAKGMTPPTAKADRWTVVVDGKTYVAVLPDVCNNLAGMTVKCRLVNIETRDVLEIELHYRYESDDDCWGYREVSTIGEPDSPSAEWKKPGKCKNGPCDFQRVDANVTGPPMGLVGTIKVKPGKHQFRVSYKVLDICILYAGKPEPESSFTSRVRPAKDYRPMNGYMQAHVRYSSAELPPGVRMNEPFGLFSWASSQDEAARINSRYAER